MMRADVLLETWGEPADWRVSWWNLWPGNWPFAPQTLWSWPVGERTLRCRIDHPFYDGFRATACDCRVLAPGG